MTEAFIFGDCPSPIPLRNWPLSCVFDVDFRGTPDQKEVSI
jgi:hypothetical protein